ncbi:MAG: hypothetical protein ACRDQ0_11895, partial [Pseudonocardia sp.]
MSNTYELSPEATRLDVAAATQYRFRILAPDGTPVVSFAEIHEKQVHLIVVRRDLTGYRHLHPTTHGDGLWTVPLPALEPGEHRVFADFSPAGSGGSFTVGADLTVEGDGTTRELPAPTSRVVVEDHEVELAGSLVPGAPNRLTFTVRRSGHPVTDLQPYL